MYKISNTILAWLIVFLIAISAVYFGANNASAENLHFGHLLTVENAQTKKWNFQLELVGDYSDSQRFWVQRAYEISDKDMEFMYMLKAENGEFSNDRQSSYVKKGIREPSFGYCQIHAYFHPEIVNDHRFFKDPAWQLAQCYQLWSSGTVFYGYDRIQKDRSYKELIKSHFILKV